MIYFLTALKMTENRIAMIATMIPAMTSFTNCSFEYVFIVEKSFGFMYFSDSITVSFEYNNAIQNLYI